MKELIRTVRLTPYRKGGRPTFTLRLYHTAEARRDGKTRVAYDLRMHTRDTRKHRTATVVLFDGDDFGCSPLHATDSDACVRGLMTFLTLRPGDTDAEWFANYTDEQRAYCDAHAETLSLECMARFGDD